MVSLEDRPGGLTLSELQEHRARVYVGRRCVLGSTLVVPLWTVWIDFQGFAKRNGFQADARALRSVFDKASWAEVIERPQARGKLKTIVKGVGIKPMVPQASPEE
jgi:hypothetical protein